MKARCFHFLHRPRSCHNLRMYRSISHHHLCNSLQIIIIIAATPAMIRNNADQTDAVQQNRNKHYLNSLIFKRGFQFEVVRLYLLHTFSHALDATFSYILCTVLAHADETRPKRHSGWCLLSLPPTYQLVSHFVGPSTNIDVSFLSNDHSRCYLSKN